MTIDSSSTGPRLDGTGTSEGPRYSVRPLNGSTWEPFAELVERNGGVFGGCWCMGHHQTPDGASYHQVKGIDKRATKEQLVRSGQAHAALVFNEEGLSQGWAKYGRIDELPLLAQHGRAYNKESSPRPDWRVACFYTDKNHRREGIARAALEGALDLIAEAGGGTVEAIPEIITDRTAHGRFLFAASVELFEDYGFERVRQLGKWAWLVRRVIRPRPAAG